MKGIMIFTIVGGVCAWAGAVDVTVYNQDLGLVRETRSFSLNNGVNNISITDVPAQIDATSVHFKSLSNPDAVSVLEQNFQYDLLNQQKLLEKYVGKEIVVERATQAGDGKPETLKGTLLANNDGLILKSGDKIHLNFNGHITLPDVPNDFQSRPTLVWKIQSKKSGPQSCELSYLTGGLGWKADYVLVANAADDKMDLNSWVTISNTSGGRFEDAKLKLVAGDVNRVQNLPVRGNVARFKALDEMAAAPAFTEQGFFEYHLYTLQRPTTLANNETKQIEMASAAEVPMKKLFIYDGAQNVSWLEFNDFQRADPNYGTQGNKKVWVILEFKNSKENNLGTPLPKGRVRVYKKSTDGALEFIGEDNIDHTPKDETLRIKMGNAFDVVGERTRTAFVNEKKSFQETFEIHLRNHKDADVTVRVVEHLYRWSNWKIPDASAKYSKKDAQTVEFEVPVKKDGESVVTYTVKYSWP